MREAQRRPNPNPAQSCGFAAKSVRTARDKNRQNREKGGGLLADREAASRNGFGANKNERAFFLAIAVLLRRRATVGLGASEGMQ